MENESSAVGSVSKEQQKLQRRAAICQTLGLLDQMLLTVDQVAAFTGDSRQTVTEMIVRGELPAIVFRSGKKKHVYKVRLDSLRRWLNAKEREGQGRKVVNLKAANGGE
jgi:excisionase family DNA binding protein